jgi:hypothetical protein
MTSKIPTRIIISESEETYYTIKVVTGIKEVNSTIEMSALNKILDNKVWTREQFLYDTPKIQDRIYFAGVIQEMIAIIDDHGGDIVQIVYETDEDRTSEIRRLGHRHIVSEKTKQRYYIKEVEPVAELKDEVKPYDNISNDVEHLEKFFKFHTEKIMAGTLKHCDDHLVNLDDVVLFFGFSENSPMVRNFKQSNYYSRLEYYLLNTEDEISGFDKMDVFDDEQYESTKVVLVINTMILEQVLEVIYMSVVSPHFWEKLSLVVCDTNMERESTILLSLCRRHNITHVKKIQYGPWFNFGVCNEYQKCTTHQDDSNNAVISFTNNVYVGNRNFVVFVDSRYANIYRIVSAMELCPDVWTISIIHDIFDDLVKNYYEYKFMPYYQTDQITRLANVMRRGIFHTPLAFYTKFPAIAKMLFEASIFVSCDKEHFKVYIENINKVFNEKIDKTFKLKLEFINTAKTIASERALKVELIKEAIVKHQKKRIIHDITYGKQEKLLVKTLEKIKIR